MRGTRQTGVFQRPAGFDFREGNNPAEQGNRCRTGAAPQLWTERNPPYATGMLDETREGVESRTPQARKLGRRI